MNRFEKELVAMTWAMHPRHFDAMLSRIGSVTDEQIDSKIRAINERPELLERLRTGNGPVNLKRRSADVSEQELDIRDGVAHIQIAGPMMKQVPSPMNWLGIRATSTEAVREELATAVESDQVERIVLDIDSPGGTVDGTAALAEDVRAARDLKPVTAVVPDLMASAAMWVGAQASSIEIGPAAEVGSIGTYAVVDDTHRKLEKAGIHTHVVSSHPLKGAFVGGSQVTQAQLDDLERNMHDITSVFIRAVAEGRGVEESAVRDIATGQTWVGQDAVDMGLADKVITVSDMASRVHDADVTPDIIFGDHGGSQQYRFVTNTKGTELQNMSTWQTGRPFAEGLIGFEYGNRWARKIATTAAPAASKETPMTEQERKELDELRARTAALEEKNSALEADAAEARLRARNADIAAREKLLADHADRIMPSMQADIEEFVMDEKRPMEKAEAFLQSLDRVVRDERQSDVGGAEQLAIAVAQHGQAQGIDERSLSKIMGQSTERARDMVALGESVQSIEYVMERDNQGRWHRNPVAVLQDGRRVDRKELKSVLGLRTVLSSIIFSLLMLSGMSAHATALSDARGTTCKLSGYTKTYLMKASSTIYAGSLVMVNSSGTAEAAAASASNHGVVGVAQETKTSAASGSYWIRLSTDVICKFAGTTLGQDDVGSVVYAEDDQTVDETVGSNEPVAGVLIQYVSASVGWVHINPVYHVLASIADPLSLTGDLTAGGGAGAVTFSDSASSIVVPDADSTALLIGSTGLLNAMTFDTTDDAENVAFASGVIMNTVSVTGATTLDKSDCGKTMLVTAGIDTASITLPATIDGCRFEFVYVGADDGALLDISPNASDAVHGTCTLAASVVEFSGADDADIGATKATINTGDTITLMGDGTEGWYVLACAGIWANN